MRSFRIRAGVRMLDMVRGVIYNWTACRASTLAPAKAERAGSATLLPRNLPSGEVVDALRDVRRRGSPVTEAIRRSTVQGVDDDSVA